MCKSTIGSCKESTQCAGTTVAGFCQKQAATVKCCMPSTTSSGTVTTTTSAPVGTTKAPISTSKHKN